ncbi:hypothetical protein cypCar_00019604 [Cyprinus carpio]|nr:hypothetical protein cypCar_00019604 [Cyprinus carpio]
MSGTGQDFISDTDQDTRNWRRPPQVLKIKDRQRLFRIPREQLEDQCLHLQEENTLLKQHSRTQEQKLRRLSTKLLRLKQGPSSAGRDGELEDTIQELEARVATLESQRRALQSKLSLAKQHILDLGIRTHNRPRTGRGVDGDGGVRRAAQTAPARYGISSLEDTRGEIDRFRSTIIENQQGRVAELELSAQSLRESLRDKDKEIEGIVKDLRKQQADGHRLIIKDNVDVIRLQKQLCEKSTSLLVLQEKFAALQEAYENQLEEGQRSLKESQGALLGKVEELSELLKQEKQRVLTLEGQLNAATLSLQALGELQERVSDLEGERNLLKNSYDSLLECTMSVQNHQEGQHEKKDKRSEQFKDESWREDVRRLEERLEEERKEKKMLEQEKEQLRQESDRFQKEKERDRDMVMFLREKHDCLEQEVLQHRQEVTSLQEKLDSVTKEFDMSVEDLSETLLQIKAFRMQRETQGMMCFLKTDEKIEETSKDLTAVQASYAETVLELQKTRDLLLLQHRLNADLQNEMKTVVEKFEREREENRRRAAQLKDIAYSPRNYKQTIPLQYTWTGLEQESVKPAAEGAIITQLRGGESLLEIHLTGATFTPLGLRLMGQGTGGQPNYGFTSQYALTESDLEKLRVQGGSITVELHQALGGVQFMTRGRARISLMGALQRTGERMNNRTNITGDYVLRDPAGSPRGMVRATLRWKYPFQSPEAPSRQREGVEKERMVPSTEVSQRPIAKPRGDRLSVEILSLSFNRSSSVALDQSVHQVYVEYRLLGIPMETTETPMSLRKPTDGEEIHYNFTRVIHVDSMEAAPLRHYLYTMLEGTDPNQGRLKFTVVSEPMNEQEECKDVGYAYLDLQELLLTGNDIIEEQINVVSADEEQDVVGKLKVSVEAAQALTGIYQEYHQIVKREREEPGNSTENEEEEESGIQKRVACA